MMRPFKSCQRLWRDRCGTGAIEFALVAPLLAAFALGISDLSLGLARKFKLEQATYRALELVTVGTITTDNTYLYVRGEAATAAAVPPGHVDVVTWLECDGARKASFDLACLETEHTARFLTVTIRDSYTPIFPYGPLGESFLGSVNGKIPLTARSTIRMQ